MTLLHKGASEGFKTWGKVIMLWSLEAEKNEYEFNMFKLYKLAFNPKMSKILALNV